MNPPPLNPSRVSREGTFGFLGKGGKKKAIMDESPEEREARLLKQKFDDALREVRKNVSKAHGGPAQQFLRKVMKEGGEAATILREHTERNRAFLNPE